MMGYTSIIVLITLVVAVHSANDVEFDGPQGRILGGDEALAGVFPYIASLRVDNAHVCGGNIIAVDKILTTAHCVERNSKALTVDRLTVRVGSTNQYAGGKIVFVRNVIFHPDYYGLKNNLAIIELTEPLELTDRVEIIPIASVASDKPNTAADVTVAGWGKTVQGTMSSKIRAVQLIVASDEACKDAYSAHDESSLCLAHDLKEGTCHGDGGSGAVYNKKLIGLTNFVVGSCGSRYPDVFVNVAHYADWINSFISA